MDTASTVTPKLDCSFTASSHFETSVKLDCLDDPCKKSGDDPIAPQSPHHSNRSDDPNITRLMFLIPSYPP